MEKDSVLLANLSTNTKQIMVDKLYFTSLTAGSSVKYKIYIAPTVSANGTSLAIRNSNTAFNGGSQMQVFRDPTISNRGAFLHMYSVPDGTLIDVFGGRVIVKPGTKILLTTQVTVVNSDWNLTVSWFER